LSSFVTTIAIHQSQKTYFIILNFSSD